MLRNLPLGLKLGFARNIERDRKEIEDAKANIKELDNLKRQWLFTTYQTDTAANRKSAKARSSLIKQATGFGFSKKAAMVLESSGELGGHLERIKKLKLAGLYNENQVKVISNLILESLNKRPEEEQKAALNYFAQGDLNFNNSSEMEDEFINAIFSADPDSLNKATELYSTVMAGGGGGSLNFGASGLSGRGLAQYDNTLRSGINKLIGEEVSGIFDVGTYTFDGTDSTYKGKDGEAAQDLVNQMKVVLRNNFYNANMGGDWRDAVSIMSMNLSKQSKAGMKVKDWVISTEDPSLFVPPALGGDVDPNNLKTTNLETISESATKQEDALDKALNLGT